MRAALPFALALALVAGVLTGCGKESNVNAPATPTGSSSLDEAQVAGVLASTPELIEDGVFESADLTTLDSGPADALALIRPLRYWRTITRVQRSFEFAFGDTDSTGRPRTAVVTIHKRLFGTFNILAGVPSTDSTALDSTARVVRKPLEDHWVRRILLKRVPTTNDERCVWRVAATSGVRVTSRDAATRIVSLRVMGAAVDTTLTDPLAFFWLRRVLRFDPQERVTLIVTTLRNDDVVVLQHRNLRFRFHNNGDNTYTGVWPAPMLMGMQHVGVNALSHGTLFDDAQPYDSQAWILPYLVRPNQLAEYMP
jgi:hypothetical protein